MTRDHGTALDPESNAEDPDLTLTERFLAFHATNPQVYVILRRLAREWLTRGKGKCGIALLYNRCRWELTMAIEGEDVFELNDHYQAFYSRALMFFETELAGMFDTRRAPEADRWIDSVRTERGVA